jgi:3-hydroxyisobutyrate dehydrogenase-like beta-hydroxyacid dehydrogenase
VAGVSSGSARQSPYPRSVGVFGTGFLAPAVTRRLLDGLPGGTPVAVFGRSPEMLRQQVAMGATRAASPADLAARSEVVFLLLSDIDQLEAQLVGPSGFEAGVHSPTVAVIGTAAPPERLRILAHRVFNRTAGRLRLVDAPLSGPKSAVLSGELSIAVGAASSAYPEIEPVLSILGHCLRVGGVGYAQVAHACEQLVLAAEAIGVGEAVMIAERAGLDVDALLANWRRSTAMNRIVEAARQQLSVSDAERELPATVVAGPLSVAAAEADRVGVPARMLAELRELGQQLDTSGLSDRDLSTAYRRLTTRQVRKRSGDESSVAPGTGAA